MDPDYVEAWCNKGTLFAKSEKYLKAINCFEEALKINPEFVEARNCKGAILYKFEGIKKL